MITDRDGTRLVQRRIEGQQAVSRGLSPQQIERLDEQLDRENPLDVDMEDRLKKNVNESMWAARITLIGHMLAEALFLSEQDPGPAKSEINKQSESLANVKLDIKISDIHDVIWRNSRRVLQGKVLR